MKKIKVTSWNNGKYSATGSGYGLRIAKSDRYLFENLQNITITVDDEEVSFKIRESFGNKCSEFRSEKIGLWIIRNNNGELRWPKGFPLKFELRQINTNSYKLDYIH